MAVVEGELIATIARIELEISALDKQREALQMAVEILRQRSGAFRSSSSEITEIASVFNVHPATIYRLAAT
jgi:hypothetical protein